jgi:hypothetical protein
MNLQNRTVITFFSTKGDFLERISGATPARPLTCKILIETPGWLYSQIQAVTYSICAYLNIRQFPFRHVRTGNWNSQKFIKLCCVYEMKFCVIWLPSLHKPHRVTFWQRRGKCGAILTAMWLRFELNWKLCSCGSQNSSVGEAMVTKCRFYSGFPVFFKGAQAVICCITTRCVVARVKLN